MLTLMVVHERLIKNRRVIVWAESAGGSLPHMTYYCRMMLLMVDLSDFFVRSACAFCYLFV